MPAQNVYSIRDAQSSELAIPETFAGWGEALRVAQPLAERLGRQLLITRADGTLTVQIDPYCGDTPVHSKSAPPLLLEYARHEEQYREFTERLSALVLQAATAPGISLHSVTHRPKTISSLRGKLARPGKQYEHLSEITDLAGVRVTTYFPDEVDTVATLLRAEFTVDESNSTDKRALLAPDSFGYLSLHLVVSLTARQCQTASECDHFLGMKGEVQIRSLLQNVWAEIEHDMGYKSVVSVPAFVRRRFSRLAGLLELADLEFAAIRDTLSAYAIRIPSLIEHAPGTLPLDKFSFEAYLLASEIANRLDTAIASLLGSPRRVAMSPRTVAWYLTGLARTGISDIGALDAAFHAKAEAIVRFAREWTGLHGSRGIRSPDVTQGLCALYLCYVLVAESRDEETVYDWTVEMGLDNLLGSRATAIQILMAATLAETPRADEYRGGNW